MEILTGLFIVGLYKATEKIWEKGFDAAWEPVGLARGEKVDDWARSRAYGSLKALVGMATDTEY